MPDLQKVQFFGGFCLVYNTDRPEQQSLGYPSKSSMDGLEARHRSNKHLGHPFSQKSALLVDSFQQGNLLKRGSSGCVRAMVSSRT